MDDGCVYKVCTHIEIDEPWEKRKKMLGLELLILLF